MLEFTEHEHSVSWTLDKRAIKALIEHASKDDARTTINGIAFGENGCIWVTDGHTALVWVPGGVVATRSTGLAAWLRRDDAGDLAKLLRRGETILVEAMDDDPPRVTIVSAAGVERNTAIRITRQHTPGPISQILCSAAAAERSDVDVCLNAAYVARACKALADVSPSKLSPVIIRPRTDDVTIIEAADHESGATWVALVMPVRDDRAPAEPVWSAAGLQAVS